MEMIIPIQSFETAKVRLGHLGYAFKSIVPLSYSDGEIHFTNLPILFPMLSVKSYDSHTGHLVLSLTAATMVASKLQSLQETLLAAVKNQQVNWFERERYKSVEELRDGFQPIVEHGNLHLYCPLSNINGVGNDVQIYSKGVWTRGGLYPSFFTPGTPIRVAIRIQGLSFHRHPITGIWTGKFRLQHRVLAILVPS
jgi:hypothetical protein